MKTYWNNEGKYQKKYETLYNKHVPNKGMAKTIKGELLRCISRLYYEVYNNGLCNDKIYEIKFIRNYFNDWSLLPMIERANEAGGVDFYSKDKKAEKVRKEVEDMMNKIIKEFK